MIPGPFWPRMKIEVVMAKNIIKKTFLSAMAAALCGALLVVSVASYASIIA